MPRVDRTTPPPPPSSPSTSTGLREAAVLLLTGDEQLRQETARLAAGAGCNLHVLDDLADLRRAWPLGDAVLVGDDTVVQTALAGPPRRAGVHVVARGPLHTEGLRAAVGVGAESVVELPAGAAALASLLGDVADSDRTPGMLVAVVGGSGGVGASVLAVTLAEVTARHGHAVAVDLAPHGAGLDLLMGHEGPAPLDWDALAAGRGRMNSTALREAVARSRGAGVLGWRQGSRRELPQETVVAETLAAARRGHDLVVLDAPRRRHWPVCDAVVLVVGGSVHGVAAARRAVTDLPSGVPAGLAVRARRADTWGADVSRALGLPLWAVVPHQRGLDEHLSAGLGPARRRRSPLVRSARDLLTALDRLR